MQMFNIVLYIAELQIKKLNPELVKQLFYKLEYTHHDLSLLHSKKAADVLKSDTELYHDFKVCLSLKR